jgi:hypothetical protein
LLVLKTKQTSINIQCTALLSFQHFISLIELAKISFNITMMESLPVVIFFTMEEVPCDTPTTKAPGPRVRPLYGIRKKSATPVPILRTSPVGFPKISSDPTTAPVNKHQQFDERP